MSLDLNLIFAPSFVASLFPKGAIANLERIVQAATAEEMAAGVARVLADVQVLNVAILADPNLGPDFKLTVQDVTLAGAGDGHTFITSLSFSPNVINFTRLFIEAVGFTFDLSPEFFDFEFVLAGTGETLEGLYPSLYETIGSKSKIVSGFPGVVLGIFGLSAGAAKGTRFMAGVGGLIEQPPTLVTRNPVDSTTVPSVASTLKNLTAQMIAKKNVPPAASPLGVRAGLRSSPKAPVAVAATPATTLDFLGLRR